MRRKKIIRTLAKIHLASTLVVTVLYLSLGVYFGPAAITSDLTQKYQKAEAAVMTVSAHIVGPPTQPLVSTLTNCNNGNPQVNLLWEATEDTDNYTLYRDGEILVPALGSNSYLDPSASESTTYTYQVVANGPKGNTPSEDVLVTTGSCPVTPPPSPPPAQPIPAFNTVVVDWINVDSFTGMPASNYPRPTIAALTNVPHAQVKIKL